MKQYLDILNEILTSPYTVHKPTRTGIDTLSLSGVQFVHDLRAGFPLLTTKKMGLKSISAELEFFIKGLSDKRWLQERNCHIWDQWGNPKKVSDKFLIEQGKENGFYGQYRGPLTEKDKELRNKIQKEEPDLGRIYGVQWRDWKSSTLDTHGGGKGSPYNSKVTIESARFDQLFNIIWRAKVDPLDRGLLVTAWRPDEFDEMALRPCHYAWQILSDGKVLDLIWVQRSADLGLGIPYNIASYGLLLLLLAKELNLTPRLLIGQFADTHIYENHIELLKEQLTRAPYELPTVTIPDENWKGIFEWQYTDVKLENYTHHDKINLPIAI